MTNQNIDAYYSICLNDKCTQLFNDTILGIDYWKKHRNHKCYKCGKRGHVEKQCESICQLCNNYHPGLKICIFKCYQMLEKVYEILNKNSKNMIDKYNKIVKEEDILCKKIKEEKKNEKCDINKNMNKILNNNKYKNLIINNNNNFIISNNLLNINFNKNYEIKDIKYLNNKNYKYNNFNLLSFINIFKNNKNIIKFNNQDLKVNHENQQIIGNKFMLINNKIYDINEVNVAMYMKMEKNANVEIMNKIRKIEMKREMEKKENNEVEEKEEELIIRNNSISMYSKTEKEKEEIKKRIEKFEDKLLKKEEEKKEIKEKAAFYTDVCYQKINKIKDINIVINGIIKKEKNIRERIRDLYDKFEKKKNDYQELKEKYQGVYQRYNGIIHAARCKAERIKRQAYRAYKYHFGRKKGMRDDEIEDEIDEEDEIIERKYGEDRSKYDDEYFEMMDDDRIGNYEDDPHILDYECNADY